MCSSGIPSYSILPGRLYMAHDVVRPYDDFEYDERNKKQLAVEIRINSPNIILVGKPLGEEQERGEEHDD